MEAFQIVHRNPDSCARTRSTSLSLLAPLPSAIHFSLFVPSSRTRGHVFFFLSLTLRFFSRFRHAPPAPPESAAAHTTDTEPSVETTQPGIKGARAATEKIRKRKLVFSRDIICQFVLDIDEGRGTATCPVSSSGVRVAVADFIALRAAFVHVLSFVFWSLRASSPLYCSFSRWGDRKSVV